jgi:hypothetical protein
MVGEGLWQGVFHYDPLHTRMILHPDGPNWEIVKAVSPQTCLPRNGAYRELCSFRTAPASMQLERVGGNALSCVEMRRRGRFFFGWGVKRIAAHSPRISASICPHKCSVCAVWLRPYGTCAV